MNAMFDATRRPEDSAAMGANGVAASGAHHARAIRHLPEDAAVASIGLDADADANGPPVQVTDQGQRHQIAFAAGHATHVGSNDKPVAEAVRGTSGVGSGKGTTLVVQPGAVLEIRTALPASDMVQFSSGYGTLRLDVPGTMHATISGFAGTAPVVGQSDIIDLVGVGTLKASNLSYSAATGVLTVSGSSGAPVAALQLSGTYTQASFKVASDGAGGTNILDPTLNPIVLENEQAGTPMSVWAINGNINNSGNDAAIQGFATSMSIDPGQVENFKIDTTSSQYRIDIYRLGYYGGDGARLISSQMVNKATNQPNPLFNAATNEVDAGNWSVSASWAVPTGAVSGVYFAKLTTLNGTIGQNMIPFVVTNGGAASAITFQTNDSTWEAYNPWGGYNLYQGPSGTTADRANAVSYNRPIDMNSTSNEAGPQDFVFSGELPAIYWLEQNGYNVNYITSTDTATKPASLTNSQVFLDSGHDEYWSKSQYNNVQAAANAGVGLVFLSGNQVYWDVAYTSGLDGSANTTVVEYKDPWAGKQIDPSGTAGGGASTFRDPVNGPDLPENSLTGNIFQVDGSATLGNITVPYNLSQFKFWSNTSVANLAPGGSVTLANLLGYEWNTDNNNGFRPAGVVDLSSTTASVGTLLLDYGLNIGDGTATHNLTLYRDTASGALIFSAGTVMWSWGLDTEHPLYEGQTAPVSSTVQQAMVNLFAQMGVQPQTLVSSLVYASQTASSTPPVSKITSIGTGGPLLSNQTVTITGTATDPAGGKVAMVEISTDGGKTWDRAIGFGNWTYSWIVPAAGNYTIETRATNDSAYLEKPSDATPVTVAAGSTSSLLSSSPGDVIVNSTVADNLNSNDPSPVELGLQFVSSRAGIITGIRFWKGAQDTGSHTASLWTATGALLATGTFSGETATGWQTLLFSSPVAITAGTSYVAGYHSNGFYAIDSNYFTAPVSNGPLSAVETGKGASLYSYNGSSVFPTTSGGGDNYWVDVLFAPAGTNQPPIANNDTGFGVTENVAVTIPAAALLANDSDPNGLALSVTGVGNPTNGTVAFNASTNTITFTPTTGYTGAASFTYSITDTAGLTASAGVTLSVAPPGALSLWSLSTIPATLSSSDTSAVELGLKFTASSSGTISGLRYYKSANDTGTHVGSLWTGTGTLVASATFTNETASGWQTVNFASPVAITGGTTYVAGYHSNGHYADSANYFTNAYTNGPLTALASGSTGNGVYTYGASSVFPTSTYNATNYWVDVLYQAGALKPPVAADDGGFVAVENTPLSIAASALLANDTDPNGLPLSVTGVSNAAHGTVAFNAATNTITFTPSAGYTGPASFSYGISDTGGGTASANVALAVNAPKPPVANADSGFAVAENGALTIAASALLANDTDPNGLALSVTGVSSPSNGTVVFNAAANTVTFTPSTGYTGAAGFTYAITDTLGGTASATVALTVNAPKPPVANADSGFTASENTALTIAATALLANDTDPNGLALSISGVGNPVNGTVAFNAAANTITFTPTSGYTGPASFSYTITDSTGLTASASVAMSVAVPAPLSLWTTSTTPAVISSSDTTAVELGMKFTASAAGVISGLRYYKSANDPGMHVGSLWSSGGALLASATFTNETASGWQTVNFATPVNIAAGTTYVAGYHSNGHYADSASYFTTAYVNGPLTALASGSTGNGVYTYGASSVFPTSTYSATNYWVDVLYQQGSTGPAKPPVATGDSGLVALQNAPLVIETSTLLANDTDPSGLPLSVTGVSNAANGTVALNTATNTITFTPTAGYTGPASFTYSIANTAGGTASASVGMSVTASSALTSASLFSTTNTPGTITNNDPAAVELGTKFTSAKGGTITGIQFYKGPLNTGVHTADLWNSSGTLLATANFSNETASGWQSATFAAPVAIAAGETDIAAYHTNTGEYSTDANYFAAAHTNGVLTAPSSASSGGNGVYAYGSASLFPTNSFNATNYWVDVTMKS